MIETAGDLVGFFDDSAVAMDKIYVPDILDEKIAKNILQFLERNDGNLNLAELTVVRYMKSISGFIVSIKQFAQDFEQHYYGAKADIAQEERVKKLMEQTAIRMDKDSIN